MLFSFYINIGISFIVVKCTQLIEKVIITQQYPCPFTYIFDLVELLLQVFMYYLLNPTACIMILCLLLVTQISHKFVAYIFHFILNKYSNLNSSCKSLNLMLNYEIF